MERTARTTRNGVPHYWNMVKRLSTDEKLDLIVLLTQSLKEDSKSQPFSAKDFYGVMADDGFTAEEMVNELKGMRQFRHDIIEL